MDSFITAPGADEGEEGQLLHSLIMEAAAEEPPRLGQWLVGGFDSKPYEQAFLGNVAGQKALSGIIFCVMFIASSTFMVIGQSSAPLGVVIAVFVMNAAFAGLFLWLSHSPVSKAQTVDLASKAVVHTMCLGQCVILFQYFTVDGWIQDMHPGELYTKGCIEAMFPLIALVFLRPGPWSFAALVAICTSNTVVTLHSTGYYDHDLVIACAHGIAYFCMEFPLWYVLERTCRVSFIHQIEGVRQAQQKSAAEQRSKSYQHVVAATAHDLRTCASAVVSGCRVLTKLNFTAVERGEDRTPEKKLMHSMAAMSKWNCHFLDGMTTTARLLDGDVIPTQMDKIPIISLLEDSVACVKLACSPPEAVKHEIVTVPEIEQFIFSDVRSLTSNLLNLLSNASKHTHLGSIKLLVSLTAGTESQHACPMLRIAVRDTGSGVKDEFKSIIFDPFISMDGSTGLGLYVVRKQAESLGGACGTKDNPEGSGSEFWFEIPYFTSDQSPPHSCNNQEKTFFGFDGHIEFKETAGTMQQGSSQMPLSTTPSMLTTASTDSDRANIASSILLIDDNVTACDLHALELSTLGYQVVTGIGANGLHHMKEKRFDVVFIDYKMPFLNGDEVVAAFRHWESFNRTGNAPSNSGSSGGESLRQPIYALSAGPDPEMQRRCRAAGLQGVLAKPIDIHSIQRLVEAVRHGADASMQVPFLA